MMTVSLAHLAVRLVSLLLAFVVIGCGDGDRPSDSDRQRGRLVVDTSLAGPPVFFEGSLTQLRIVQRDGTEVVDDVVEIETYDAPIFDRAVPEDAYQVTAVERPCSGSCDALDAPLEGTRCKLPVDVRANRTTRVAIVLRATPTGARSDCSVSAGP